MIRMSKTPIVRPVSFWGSVVTLAVLAVFATLGWLVFRDIVGVAVGCFVYILVSQSLRFFICKHHRRGIVHCKRQEFRAAIDEFQASYDYFCRNPWIDRYRCLALLSSAAMQYREMALVSLGFCYSQIGQGEESKRAYEQCLELFPDSGMAIAALNMMQAASSLPNAAQAAE